MRIWKVFVLAIGVAHAPAVLAQSGGEEPSAAQLAPGFGGEKSLARASRDSIMGFTFPADIREVKVKGGDVVKKGDILVMANADEARAQRDLQKLLSETDLDVRRSQAAVDQAQIEVDAQEEMKKEHGGTPVEYLRAKAQLEIRQVDLDISKFQQTQQKVQLAYREAAYERSILRAPFDGVIDQVLADPGEVKRDGEPVIRIVNIDALWIDVAVPASLTITLALKPGAPAWVLMDLPGAPRVYRGKVIEVSPAVDERSNTRRVRVELSNAAQWPAGLTCWVRFTEPTGEWAPRIVASGGSVALDLDSGTKK